MPSRRPALTRGVAVLGASALALTTIALAVPSASGAASLQPRGIQYGDWVQPGSGLAVSGDDTMSQVYQLTSRSQFPDLASVPGPTYAAGTFVTSGVTTINRVGQWNGTAWTPLTGDTHGIEAGATRSVVNGATVPGVYGMVLSGDDSLFAGGEFDASNATTLNNVGRWNGTSWLAMGAGLRITTAGDVVQDMVMGNDFIGMDDTNYADDTVYAIGGFVGTCNDAGCGSTARTAKGIAQYSQADDTWYPVGSGTLTGLQSSTQMFAGAYIDDTLYVGGNFTTIGGVSASLVAQHTAAGGWEPLGAGLGSTATSVYAMAVHPTTKDLYVGGTFGQPVGGVAGSTPGIIKWDYTDDTWYAVGTGLTSGNIDDIGFSADGTTMWLGGWNGFAAGTQSNHVLKLTSSDLADPAAQAVSGAWDYVQSAGVIGVTGPSNGSINQSAVRAVLPQPNGSVMFGGNFHTAGPVNAGRVGVFTPGAAPDPYAPVYPPGAPTDVKATGKWKTVQVNWKAPSYTGSYPITNYLVTANPGGQVCITRLTDPDLTECTFRSLTPGTVYTFTVQGLNGGGWGERSAASNPATPQDIRITSHSRKKNNFFQGGGSTVTASGIVPGFAAGTQMTPWLMWNNSGTWEKVTSGGPKVGADGKFSWQRKFSKKQNGQTLSVKFTIGEANESNSATYGPVK